jgi:hypothetical protein
MAAATAAAALVLALNLLLVLQTFGIPCQILLHWIAPTATTGAARRVGAGIRLIYERCSAKTPTSGMDSMSR